MNEQFLLFSFVGLLSVVVMMLLVWIVHLVIRNAGLVDVFWGLGFVLITSIYVLIGEGLSQRNILLIFMVGLWGVRLSYYILRRMLREEGEDKRYAKARREWGKFISLKFLFFFEFQALLQAILAVPFLLIALNTNPGVSWLEWLGFAVWTVGLLGEVLADEQLKRFKSDPQNKGQVCNQGLWKYSRHPNYFFEWIIWVGFYIFACASPWGWASIASPIIMFWLLTKVTGVPLAEEQSLASKGDLYRVYQQTTNAFFPIPKKL